MVGIFAFLIIVFGVSFSSMWDLWQTSDHRHGLLIFPISVFLIWQKRHELIDVPVVADPRGFLPVILLTLIWLLARLAGVQVIEHVAVLSIYPAVVMTLGGWMLLRKLLFPILFLLLATPLGESLVPSLMVITADISAGLLKLSGIPLLRNGQYMSLPGGDFVVADVCSGLRYLMSGLMLSLLFGYLTFTQQRKRLVLVLVTALTLVIANGFRAYIVMAIASASDMRYLGGRDHIYFGWLMFGIVMLLIMWISARFADKDDAEDIDVSDSMVMRASRSGWPLIGALVLAMLAVTVKPLQADFGETGVMLVAAAALFAFIFLLVRHHDTRGAGDEPRSRIAAITFELHHALVSAVLVIVLVGVARLADAVENRPVSVPEDTDIASVIPCSVAGPWRHRWQPSFDSPDHTQSATFDCAGEHIGIFVSVYASALQGAELISSSNYIIPPQWNQVSTLATYSVPDGDRDSYSVGEYKIDSPGSSVIVWYWYEVDGRISHSPLVTKFNQILALVRGRPAGGRVIVIETTNTGDTQLARGRLKKAASEIIGAGAR